MKVDNNDLNYGTGSDSLQRVRRTACSGTGEKEHEKMIQTGSVHGQWHVMAVIRFIDSDMTKMAIEHAMDQLRFAEHDRMKDAAWDGWLDLFNLAGTVYRSRLVAARPVDRLWDPSLKIDPEGGSHRLYVKDFDGECLLAKVYLDRIENAGF